MFKKRIVPEHEEQYIICDICGDEITDYSHISTSDGKHFHNMYAGGEKGVLSETCYDVYEKKLLDEYRKRHSGQG